MTHPTVTALPTAPSRISNPENFVTESALFLAALPKFREQTNTLSSYINSVIPNKYNFGSISTPSPTFPNIQQYTGSVVTTGVASVEYISSIDVFYEDLQIYSSNLNNVGIWVDTVVANQGVVSYYLDKPMVSGITYPHSRNQTREDFNNSAELFTETGINNINSLYQSVWYIDLICHQPDDFGSITDTNITENIRCGSILDTEISN